MKHFAVLTLIASFALPFAAHAANPQQVGACVGQMTEKNITDKTSATKVCTCVVDEQAKITQAQITNMVGSKATPFVTGILQTINLDELLGQWENELDQFISREQTDFTSWMDGEKSEYNNWFKQMKADLLSEQAFLDQWIASEQTDFLTWFNQMKGQLSQDAAGNLQLEIDKEKIERILLVGFVDGSKVFSDDGTTITSTASDGRTLVKTFTNGFLTMTNVLKSSAGAEVARLVKTFDSNGKLINTVVTYS